MGVVKTKVQTSMAHTVLGNMFKSFILLINFPVQDNIKKLQ